MQSLLQFLLKNPQQQSPRCLLDVNMHLKRLSCYLNQSIIEISKHKQAGDVPKSANPSLSVEQLIDIYESIAKNLALIIGNDTDPFKLLQITPTVE
jgi:hypothetical protein